ncbi:hypothetical protein [Flavobacterium sp. GCM10023249]|uniref:hypothetical protein n=1 Tax=unclassified Flavobacterium TaxID=196869 RepID=UPI003623C992
MNFLEKCRDTAEKIDFTETENYFTELCAVKKGKIKSTIPTINGIEIEFGKDAEWFSYKTERINFCENPSQYQHTNYGIIDSFDIQVDEREYKLPYGAKTSSFSLKLMELSGQISKIEHNFSDEKTHYFRAILPLDKYAKPPLKYFLGRGIVNGESLKVAGYVDLKINENVIGFYDYEINKKEYIIIDCKTKVKYELFEDIVESILHPFALISGNLIRESITILKFKQEDFSNIIGFKFKKLDDSIVSLLEIYNPDLHKDYFDLKETFFFPTEIFSNLCQLSYNSKPLLRAIRTLTQARNQPVEIETAAYFITLETVKQIIIEENEDKISPIKDKAFAKYIVRQLRAIIKPLAEENFNDKNAVIRKIENINGIANADGFNLAFQIMGIQLTKDDQECINNRNKFLHGSIPFDHDTKENRRKELSKINLNAHLITCALILKYAGYSGPIKNYLKYLDLINNLKSINQPLFRTI